MVLGLGLSTEVVLGAAALIGLIYAAEVVVNRLTRLAEYYEIPDVVVALTVLSVGTSLPELASHMVASVDILTGRLDYEIASATVLCANIGSDVVQQTLVVGLVVLFATMKGTKQFEFSPKFLRRDYAPMIGTTLMTLALAWDGILSRLDGLVLLSTFILYTIYIYEYRGKRLRETNNPSENPRRDALVVIAGLLVVIVSAEILLGVVQDIVMATGLGGSLIGVVTLGVASALPEMFTAISGIRNGSAGIPLGTLIGSNITNPLLAIGAGSILSTYWVPRPLVLWDLPMETFTAGMLLAYLLFVSDRKLGKWGALYLIGLYGFYITIRFLYFPFD